MDNSHPVVAYIGQACALSLLLLHHPSHPPLTPPFSHARSAWAFVQPHFSAQAKDLLTNLISFVEVRLTPSPGSMPQSPAQSGFKADPLVASTQDECMPAEKLFHDQISTDPKLRWKSYPRIIEDLKDKAKQRGLWQLWMNKAQYGEYGGRLSNLEYSVCAEIMGHAIRIAPEATNSSAPDTGNMGPSSLPPTFASFARAPTDLSCPSSAPCRGPRALRQQGAAGQVAQAPHGGQDPLELCHDRARRREFGRDQHPHLDRPRREDERDRHQRPQVVDLGRWRPAQQGPPRHGQVVRRYSLSFSRCVYRKVSH